MAKKPRNHLHTFGQQCQRCVEEHPEDHRAKQRLLAQTRKRVPQGHERDRLRKEFQRG